MIDLAPLVDDMAYPGGLVVETYTAATISNAYGEAVYAAPTTTTITCIAHPAGRRELARLPEGDRHKQTIAIYSEATLAHPAGTRPLVVRYEGRRYEVVKVADYSVIGGLSLALAQLIEE
jgi:hypothetical protein